MKIKIKHKTFFIIFIFGLFFQASGCSKLTNFSKGKTAKKTTCADQAISRAFNLHEDAKSDLALFFEERSDDQLYKAFYAASDSVRESFKVKKCWDRRISHYYAMRNLKELNTSLARVIRRNLPDDDSGEMITVFHNQYDWVLPHMS